MSSCVLLAFNKQYGDDDVDNCEHAVTKCREHIPGLDHL